MRLHVLAVGDRMPEWIVSACEEYEKRMPREARINLKEIRPEKRDSGKSVSRIQEAEAGRIMTALPKACHLVVLDERGELFSTMDFAGLMEGWMKEGKDVVFVIGGADGVWQDLKQKADKLFSLSRMTLPHGIARVMLIEQLYRAVSIINHHPYHREG